jgi:large subunit ribosomal protein L1
VGKTKTAFVSGMPGEEKSGKAAYEAKRKRKLEEEKKRQADEKKAQVGKVGLKGGERIKVVSGPAPEEVAAESDKKEEAKSQKKPKVRSKKYKDAKAQIDRNKLYSVKDAVKLVKKTSYSKFNGSVELHLVAKKPVNVNVELPHSTGSEKKVEVADDKTIKKLKAGKIDFDILLATADMMPKLVPFAKLLGPKGLMPNPKAGTLIKSAKDADKFKGNNVVVKTEKKQPVIHTIVGKVDMDDKKLSENISAVIEAVGKKQLLRAYLASTMSPSVKIKI